MSLKTKRTIQIVIRYTVLTAVGIFMIYPLLWMIGATFKPNNEIFSGLNILPKKATFEGYINAMKNYGGDINIWKAMLNTYSYVIPAVIFTIVSSTLTAYGFGRFKFFGRSVLFAILMSTLFFATGGFKCTAVYYVQYFRMGRFKALSATYCAFNVCDRDLFCIHAYSVFKKYT